MRVNCNIGAVIKITRRSLPYVVGRVTGVSEHEVTICIQARISYVGCPSNCDYRSTSADTKTILHINSDLIDDWTFATVNDLPTSSSRHPDVQYIDEDQWSSVVLNYYDKDGFCTGDMP